MSESDVNPTPEQKRTINILYIPGGGIFGIIPAMVLGRIEELTECTAIELFQVVEGVSTGSILAAGINVPEISGTKGADLFAKLGPQFFPEKPNRLAKMAVANGLTIFKEFANLDPLKKDSVKVKAIKRHCDKLRGLVDDEKGIAKIDELEELACARWFTKNMAKRALRLCDQLQEYGEREKNRANAIAELLSVRQKNGMLSSLWKRSANAGIHCVKSRWAKASDYLYDPTVAMATFDTLFGELRMKDTLRSTYISAYDAKNQEIITFRSRKKDFFALGNDTEQNVRHNVKLSDAVMGSIAHQGAFPPHTMEDGRVVLDKAIVHQPQAIDDVLQHKPEDADVKIVVLGTGKVLDVDEEISSEEIVEKYRENNILGNLLIGNETSELEAYVMSSKIKSFKRRLGEDHVVEINPRMTPHTPREEREFPSGDETNASEENMEKIIRRGAQLLRDRDTEIRNLAQSLIDNLRVLGQIDEEKYRRASERIGIAAPVSVKRDQSVCLKDGLPKPEKRPTEQSRWSLRAIFQGIRDAIQPSSNKPEPQEAQESAQEPVQEPVSSVPDTPRRAQKCKRCMG